MKRFERLVFVCLFCSLFCMALAGCQDGKPADGELKISVTVSVEPQAFLLDRIGGDRVAVEILVPAGKEPEHFQAPPSRVAALARSKAVFLTGMPFEETLLPKVKALNSELKTVDLRSGIVLRTLELHSHSDSGSQSTQHVHHAGCSHDGLDPHVWFSPGTLKVQADTVLATLIELDPEGREHYESGHARFLLELEQVRASLAKMLEPFRGRTVFVFHPSYGYFCDEFGLKQRALEYEGKSPGAKQIAEIVKDVRSQAEEGRTAIFVQPEFNKSPAEAISEDLNAALIEHSCLRRDLFQSMLDFAQSFVASQN